jgi:hypothetical protein
MTIEAQIIVEGTRASVWAAIADIENAATFISGIQTIEILKKPVTGLVGLRWKETRMLYGKPATVEKWITDAVENEFYKTRAEDGGFIFLTTKRLSQSDNGITLEESHESKPQSIKAKLSIPMLFLFRGAIKKALLQNLTDIKSAVERK